MVLLRKEEYPEIDTGEYVAQLIDVKDTQSKRNPQFGPSIRFAFRILEQPYVNAVVSGLATAKLLAGNKLDKWLTGLGYEVEIGGNLDTDQLIGRTVRVYVERDEGSKYTNVKNVYALRETDKPRIDAKAKLLDKSAAPAPTQTATPAPQNVQVNPGTSAGNTNANVQVNPPAPTQNPPAAQPTTQPQNPPAQPSQPNRGGIPF